jgi:hypothetical protein
LYETFYNVDFLITLLASFSVPFYLILRGADTV